MDLVHKINGLRARPAAYWVTAANQNLPGWSSWLLVVAIAWYSARLIWAVMPQQDEFDWSVRGAPTSGPTAAVSNSSAVDYSRIAAAHLFGVAGANPVVSQTVDAPETRLDLKLRGTVAADDSSMAHAIIADGRGNDDVPDLFACHGSKMKRPCTNGARVHYHLTSFLTIKIRRTAPTRQNIFGLMKREMNRKKWT